MAQLLKEVTGKITEVARKDEQPKREGEEAQKTNTGGSEIQISADEATNTLLIFAPADTLKPWTRSYWSWMFRGCRSMLKPW